MVRSDGKFHSLQVESQMRNCPRNGQALFLGSGIILFRLVEGTRPKSEGEEFSTGLLLGQTTAKLTIRGIRV
jgi:hypothetical protein